jgi:glycine betaine catabolism A
MLHSRIVDVVRRAALVARSDAVPLMDRVGSVPTRHYSDASRLERERARLFRGLPIPIAHASEIRGGDPENGGASGCSAVVREVDGISIVLTRAADGVVRAFRNACRHRGVRLLRDSAPCKRKALVCPYHGWTYGLDGRLMHVPHAEAFDLSNDRHLVPVRVEERHGLLWIALDDGAPSVQDHLGEIDDEIASLDFGSHVVGERVVREQRGNWKTLVEAFLEGYHIRTLHRDSVYPFFLDARSVAECAGPHVRAASARRAAREMPPEADDAIAEHLREVATVSYVIFPSTTLIAHPDWTSLVVVQPLATDRFLWSHTQLLAEAPANEAARAHFAKSFALIDGKVFAGEDLLMCAEAQHGLETGANEELLFGRLETPVLWFHDAIRERLG